MTIYERCINKDESKCCLCGRSFKYIIADSHWLYFNHYTQYLKMCWFCFKRGKDRLSQNSRNLLLKMLYIECTKEK